MGQTSRFSVRACGIVCLVALLLQAPGAAARHEGRGGPLSHQAEHAHERLRAGIENVLAGAAHAYVSHARIRNCERDARAAYAAVDYELLWSRHDGPGALARGIVDVLLAARDVGLRPEHYDAALLAEQWQAVRDEKSRADGISYDLVLFDVALTVSFLQFAADLHAGRSNADAGVCRPRGDAGRIDVPALVRYLRGGGSMAAVLAALEPRLLPYRLLARALPVYRRLARRDDLGPVPIVDILRAGERYRGMVELRELLRALGDLASEAGEGAGDVYGEPVVQAVKRFQRRHGLDDDGIIGPSTFAQLNTPLAWRVRQIELSMERYRWLPPPARGRYVLVNIPGFSLSLFEWTPSGARPVGEIAIIVGEAVDRHQTPVFVADMQYLVFQPYWNVPYSIMATELLPQIRRDSGFLARNHMELVDRFDERATVAPATDHAIARLASGSLKLRQRPGPDNALGSVKFILPNPFNVYLHSTPATGLFERSRRDFSHGCIRVSDPVALARFALRENPGWSHARIGDALSAASGKMDEKVVLEQPVPVFIVYATAAAQADGAVAFFDDIYGRDAALDQHLSQLER